MSWNKLQIINLAIGTLGRNEVSGYEDTLSRFASEYFDLILESVLGESNLNLARKWVELTKNDSTPVSDKWRYEYELPSDYLRMVSVSPSVDYDIIYGGKLLTNSNSIKVEYMSFVEATNLSAAFARYIAFEVAHWLSISVLENASLSDKIEKKMHIAKKSAYSQEARSVPNAYLRNNSFIQARYDSA